MSAPRVLLVDDEPSVRQSLALILTKAGYNVATAADLAGAYSQCENGPWDVVLTDLVLPDGSGIDLLRCVRDRGSEVPVIAITGEPNLETATEAVRLGAYDYVTKPIRRDMLVSVVSRAVEKHRLIDDNQRYRQNLERLVQERTADLIASEQRYRELIEQAPAMIYQLDDEGRFLTVNQTLLATVGYSLDELLVMTLADICLPAHRHRVAGHLRRIQKDGSGELDLEWLRKDGSRLNVEIRATAVRDEAGDFLLSRGFAHDVTARKRLEMQLIQADKLSTIGLMVSGVAHELNNPLTGICGYAEMLMQDAALSSELRSTLRLIYSEGERATRIVQNLLSFVRAGDRVTDYFDLHATIDSVLDLMGYRLRRGEVSIERDFDPHLGAMFGDMHQLQQVLLNLVNNALQAMFGSDRPPRLRLVTRREDGEVMVQVVDNGHGIQPTDLAHIFDPFFTTKKEGEGTGLGLSISRAAVESHGGRISVESRVGEGTTFSLWLPFSSEPGVTHNHEERRGKLAKESAPAGGGKVLVVDDELHVRNWLEKILTGLSYEVDIAISGEAALAFLDKEDYGAILTDYMMPGLDGIKLYEALGERRPHLQARLVMMSGAIDPQLDRFVRNRRITFLQKPFNAQQLIDVLQRLSSYESAART